MLIDEIRAPQIDSLQVLIFLTKIQKELGSNYTEKELGEFIWKLLKSGQVVPGYGHAVLRKTDPRYTCQREFAMKHLPNDEMFKLVSNIYKVTPDILIKQGKVRRFLTHSYIDSIPKNTFWMRHQFKSSQGPIYKVTDSNVMVMVWFHCWHKLKKKFPFRRRTRGQMLMLTLVSCCNTLEWLRWLTTQFCSAFPELWVSSHRISGRVQWDFQLRDPNRTPPMDWSPWQRKLQANRFA